MDTVTPQERSRIMSRVKSRGNQSTELKLLELFSLYKLKGWRRKYLIKGNPDFVFPKRRLAIFVDGCFWHGCPTHCRIPKSNKEYWVTKIDQNKKRDYKVTKELRGKDWTVIRLWEHELKGNQFKRKMNRINKFVQSGHT
ncbi:MAG: very short patch repair endonuclease [Candidatus Scalinduaceae bacterium]